MIGLSSTLLSNGSIFWPSLWALYLLLLRRFFFLALLLAGISTGAFVYGKRLQITELASMSAPFTITSIEPHQTPFYSGVMHKGFLTLPEGMIPCSIFSKEIKPETVYRIEGQLTQRQKGLFFCRAKKWEPLSTDKSSAFARFKAKTSFREALLKKTSKVENGQFLSALVTGTLANREMRFEFSRVGLQHILAVSGLHFAAILGCAGFWLKYFLKDRWLWCMLAVLSTIYFLFLGASPSVERSWFVSMLYLIGRILRRNPEPLNLLGVALFVELVLDPLKLLQVGFQLSFISCGAILLIYPVLKTWLWREKEDFLKKNVGVQTVLTIQKMVSRFFALTLSVSLALLPLILLHFHSFPLLSLLYNLFFPACVSILLFGLLVALTAELLLPPVGSALFWAVDHFASALLAAIHHPPLALDFVIQTNTLPSWTAPAWLCLIFGASALRRVYTNEL